jgi:hypothetical protein
MVQIHDLRTTQHLFLFSPKIRLPAEIIISLVNNNTIADHPTDAGATG